MIHYHGTPINPDAAAAQVLRGRHALISFANPEQLGLAAEVCQSFTLDNGAYSAWRKGKRPDWNKYVEWVQIWDRHPAFDWALIPDVIDGDEAANDALLEWWPLRRCGVPVWHLHESLDRLRRLAGSYDRIALGSSGQFATVGTPEWWERMAVAMATVTTDGKTTTKLHGLRMLNPKIFTRLPLASADSTNVARHVSMNERRWTGSYRPPTKAARGIVLAERIEAQQSAPEWVAA